MKKSMFKKKVFDVLAENTNETDPMFNVTYFITTDEGKTIVGGCVALASTARYDCREIHIVMWGGGYHSVHPLYTEDVFGCTTTPAEVEDIYGELIDLPRNVPAMDYENASIAFAVTSYFNGELEQDQEAYIKLAERLADIFKDGEDTTPFPSIAQLAAHLMEMHDRLDMSFDRFEDAMEVSMSMCVALDDNEKTETH